MVLAGAALTSSSYPDTPRTPFLDFHRHTTSLCTFSAAGSPTLTPPPCPCPFRTQSVVFPKVLFSPRSALPFPLCFSSSAPTSTLLYPFFVGPPARLPALPSPRPPLPAALDPPRPVTPRAPPPSPEAPGLPGPARTPPAPPRARGVSMNRTRAGPGARPPTGRPPRFAPSHPTLGFGGQGLAPPLLPSPPPPPAPPLRRPGPGLDGAAGEEPLVGRTPRPRPGPPLPPGLPRSDLSNTLRLPSPAPGPSQGRGCREGKRGAGRASSPDRRRA